MKFFLKSNKSFFLILLIIFIFTEFIDLYFDYVFGVSLYFTVIQIFLYLFIFLLTYFVFNSYYSNKISNLLTEDLINILRIIKDAEDKNIILNQKKILQILKITKPTMKKRIDRLIILGYITTQNKGNYKYFKLTSKGKTVLK